MLSVELKAQTRTIMMSQRNGKYPTTEVNARATRRRFTAEYKRQVLADACVYGTLGVLLRREGLYHSHLAKWREEREAGTLADRPRGPRPNPNRAQVQRLARENGALKRKLEQAEAIIDAQKK